MKKTYEVIWAESAEKDLISIIDYISIDSPFVAHEKFKEIQTKASNLKIYPERGRIVRELQEQGIIQYRELIISPWRIIYRISEKKVYVLSVLDSRRNVEDILLGRFINPKPQ
ncbi:MAG: type II toxin-antitoxin system RelE/ParE family toxin [Clostridiales bacterium]|nr:type II toxin-antitoxin system RelE/ParE family toxin [Clostridiales bacterium]